MGFPGFCCGQTFADEFLFLLFSNNLHRNLRLHGLPTPVHSTIFALTYLCTLLPATTIENLRVESPILPPTTNMYQYLTALLSTRSCSLSLIFSPPPNAALHYAIRLNQLRLLPLVHRSDDLLCAPVVALACSLQAPPQATSQMGHSHTIRFTCLQPIRWLSPIRSLSSIRLSLPITQIYLPRSILYRQSVVYLYS